MGLGTKAFLVGAILTAYSSVAAALGLGEITLNSALNQPLDAEIQLLQVRDLSEREIIIGLASSDEFARAGVDRTLFLTSLNFDVDLSSAEGPVVHVTSKNPVREPFINFLVSAQWPSGKLLREYTLLVDLPVFTGERAAPVQAAPRQQSTTSRPAAQPRPAPAGAASTRPASSGEEYGPVGANENLWSIASKVRPDSTVTVQQTMLALQKLNPQAFINNNINLLRRGQVLRVPDKNTIQSLSASEAVSAVADQNRRWNQQGSTADETSPQLEGSKSFTPTRSESSAPEGRVSLSSSTPTATGGGSTGAGEGESGAVENRLAVTQEELDAASRENADLKSRLSSVEEQIATMEKLVEVSSEELRSLELAAQQTNEAQAVEATEEPEQAVDEVEQETPPAAAPAPAAQSSWLDLVMENLLYIALALGALAAIAGVWFYMKRRDDGFDYDFDDDLDEEYEQDYEPQVATRPIDPGAAAIVTTDAEDRDSYDYVEPEFTAEAETEDVVGECDIHIAYGQYDQAEEKLSRALEREPANIAMRLKLLEVFAAQDDAASFDRHFARIHVLGDPAAIDRAVMLRQSIDNAEPFDLDAQDTTQFEQALGSRYESTDTQIVGFDSEVPGDEFSIADDTLQFDSEPATTSADTEWDFADSDVDIADEDDATVIQPRGKNGPVDEVSGFEDTGSIDEDDDTRIQGLAEDEPEEDDTVVVGASDTETEADDEGLHSEIESSLDAIEDSLEPVDAKETIATAVSVENTSYSLDDDVLADLDFDLDEIDADLTFDDVELDLEFDSFDQFSEDQEPTRAAGDPSDSFDLPEADAADLVIAEESSFADGLDTSETQPEPTLDPSVDEQPAQTAAAPADADALAPTAPPSLDEQEPVIPEDFELDLESDSEISLEADDDTDLGVLTATELAGSDADADDFEFADLGELDIDDEQIDGGESAVFELAEEDNAPVANNLAGAPLTGENDEDDAESIVQELTEAESELEAGPVFDNDSDDLDLADDVDFDDLDKDFATLSSEFDGDLASADALMDEPLTSLEELDLDDEQTPSSPSVDAAASADRDIAQNEGVKQVAGDDSHQFEDFEIPDFDPESDDDSNLDFLSDNDETATKLDLARAYIDMGDTDGAKDILDEIAEEGNAQQKQEAETLLARLA